VDRVDAAEHPIPDGGPVDGLESSMHAEPRRTRRRSGRVGGDHQHLRRDAAPVQAGAAEAVGLDHR
jgi:hypothetical protein